MNQRAEDHLVRLREHAGYARSLVEGMSKTNFLNDRRTYQAVLMSLLIVGEAAARVMELNLEILHPDIPWRSMRGMRNRIAHDYAAIDLDIVWETTQRALPELLSALDNLK